MLALAVAGSVQRHCQWPVQDEGEKSNHFEKSKFWGVVRDGPGAIGGLFLSNFNRFSKIFEKVKFRK